MEGWKEGEITPNQNLEGFGFTKTWKVHSTVMNGRKVAQFLLMACA